MTDTKALTRTAGPCAIVIFGASGDLTQRKLAPALYNLSRDGLLSDRVAIVGFSGSVIPDETFRDRLTGAIKEHAGQDFDEAVWSALAPRISYTQGDAHDAAAYGRLTAALERADAEYGTEGNYLFYLAMPPSLFGEIATRLAAAGLTREDRGWRRIVIEKPFGHDLDSAVELNRELLGIVGEAQIYRIDHYLGKETVQNIMVFRFANGIFEPIWNRRYVDHVQITVTEELGVESRGRYYEEAGALRDMLPNHLFQLLALTAMEPPTSFEADAVRGEKGKVLQAIQPIAPEDVLNRSVRGQYGPGTIDGDAVPGYRSEPKVNPDSTRETYAALKVLIDNWRWADVPFYVRTGKRLPKRLTEIAIQFKRAPAVLFRRTDMGRPAPNMLVLRLQPDEGIALRFGAKVPGPVLTIGQVDMDFSYEDYFGRTPSTGYETLLYDCMVGDATLFQRADNVEAGWRIVAPILDVWNAIPPRSFPNYAAGTWGPADADELVARDGRAWRRPGA
jgi:glucose-6-phosphate 1-dehydrogenase